MERKLLEDLGLEKEAIDKVMAENGRDIEREKGKLIDIEKDRDTYKQQLEGVQSKLKAFEGVNLEELNGKIATLSADMEEQKTAHANELADRDFDSLLSSEITAMKGMNAKAVKALLDVDTLKSSKNQKEDVVAALAKLKESEKYLFDAGDANNTPAKVSTGGAHKEPGSIEVDAFTAAAMQGAGLTKEE